MINSTLAFQWATACKQPDALKGVEYLTTIEYKNIEDNEDDTKIERDCCLGKLCKVLHIPRGQLFGSRVYYMDETEILPRAIAKQLNITRHGALTTSGVNLVQEYFNDIDEDSENSLTNINDTNAKDDPTLFRMGCLIEWLTAMEVLFNIEMFKAYDQS